MKFGNFLTITLVVLASVSLLLIALGQIQQSREEYRSIGYTFTRIALRYDYSCDESVYGLSVDLSNNGGKLIQNLNVSVTNGLCVGSVPPLPGSLYPGQSIQFYIYSSAPNGTISVTGNNTDLLINF
jgi:hypothetical protein